MKLRIIFLIMAFVLLMNCAKEENNNHKSIKLSSGKNVEVYYERRNLDKNYPVLLVECETETNTAKEVEIEKDVSEIWSNVKDIADEQELDEATIKYKFPTEDVNDKGEIQKIYVISVFAAEKMENNKWKIDKIS